MFISKMSLPRRTFLRGMGATVALPLLEAMVPALTATAKTAAAPTAAVRRGLHSARGDHGPATRPRRRARLRVHADPQAARAVQGTCRGREQPRPPAADDDSHATASAAWLSGAIAKKTEGQDFHLGTTVDQVIAKQIGQDTPFPSIEVATEDFTGYVGGCSPGYACAYMNTIAGRRRRTPVPMEINPRVVFERLFGRPGTRPSAPRACSRKRASSTRSRTISTTSSATSVRATGPARASISTTSARSSGGFSAPKRGTPPSVTVPMRRSACRRTYGEHVGLLFDLLAVAYQADLTRVFTFMMAREASMKTYPDIGITEPHHTISHHREKPDVKVKHAIAQHLSPVAVRQVRWRSCAQRRTATARCSITRCSSTAAA